jgi:hypothetical protein
MRRIRVSDAITIGRPLLRCERGGVILIYAIGSTLNLRLCCKRTKWFFRLLKAMKPSAECKRLAEIPREKANEIDDAELKAKYEDLARGFLRLASQIEQDMNWWQRAVAKGPNGCVMATMIVRLDQGRSV